MAGRKDKNVVDYFPHQCEHGKTLFTLDNKYPFKGYYVWFKTLELLGKSENHFIDCRKGEDWEFLSAYMKLPSAELQEIYDTCAKLGSIHGELWDNKIIWSLNFLKGIADVYKRRKTKIMDFLTLIEFLSIRCEHKYDRYGIVVDINIINNNHNTQSKVKESKGKESIKETEILKKGKEQEKQNEKERFEEEKRDKEFQEYLKTYGDDDQVSNN